MYRSIWEWIESKHKEDVSSVPEAVIWICKYYDSYECGKLLRRADKDELGAWMDVIREGLPMKILCNH